MERCVLDDRDGILMLAVVRDNEDTEQGMEDMRKIRIQAICLRSIDVFCGNSALH